MRFCHDDPSFNPKERQLSIHLVKHAFSAYCMPRNMSSYDDAPAAPAVNAADGSHRYCT